MVAHAADGAPAVTRPRLPIQRIEVQRFHLKGFADAEHIFVCAVLLPIVVRRRFRWRGIAHIRLRRIGRGRVQDVLRHLLKLVPVHFRVVEGLAAHAVEQSHLRDRQHIVRNDTRPALVGGKGLSRFVYHDVGAQPVNFMLGAQAGDKCQDAVLDGY